MSPPIRSRDGQGGNCCGIGPRQNGFSNIFHDARLLKSHGFTTPTTSEMGSIYNMSGSYIVAGARTPIGKLSGALAGFSAAELGGFAIAEALARAGVKPEEVEHVLMGQVLMAGQGQVPSRQAAVNAGIPMSVPSVNINKVCLSGLNTIYLADQMIAAGEADIVIAGGMESMTNAPYIASGARSGFRYGNTELADAIIKDGLWCAFDACLMGLGTERYTAGGIGRDVQDQFAVQSNVRAAAAIAAGKFTDEIVPITIPQRKGDPVVISTDEGVRGNTTMDSLGTLKPAFEKDGAITAGNASQLSDGASAVVVMSKKAAEVRGVKPLGEVVSYGMVAGPDNASLLHQPSNAILKALGRAGLKISDINLFEINEAFAAVGITSMKELGISDSIVNVNGGAIALGHPIGMSGNRLALTVLHELRRRGGGLGAVSLCGGGGQGDALIVRSL
jgi:acetyl-CoA C-acetyltransferase